MFFLVELIDLSITARGIWLLSLAHRDVLGKIEWKKSFLERNGVKVPSVQANKMVADHGKMVFFFLIYLSEW